MAYGFPHVDFLLLIRKNSLVLFTQHLCIWRRYDDFPDGFVQRARVVSESMYMTLIRFREATQKSLRILIFEVLIFEVTQQLFLSFQQDCTGMMIAGKMSAVWTILIKHITRHCLFMGQPTNNSRKQCTAHKCHSLNTDRASNYFLDNWHKVW